MKMSLQSPHNKPPNLGFSIYCVQTIVPLVVNELRNESEKDKWIWGLEKGSSQQCFLPAE